MVIFKINKTSLLLWTVYWKYQFLLLSNAFSLFSPGLPCALPQNLQEGEREPFALLLTSQILRNVCPTPSAFWRFWACLCAQCGQTSDSARNSELMLCTFLNVLFLNFGPCGLVTFSWKSLQFAHPILML